MALTGAACKVPSGAINLEILLRWVVSMTFSTGKIDRRRVPPLL
jgi:hypothetical protein